MPSITVIIVSLLVALTPVAGRFANIGATSRPAGAPPAVHAFDVVGGSPTVH